MVFGALGILGDLGKVLNDFLSVLRLAGTALSANLSDIELFDLKKTFKIIKTRSEKVKKNKSKSAQR